MDINGCLVRSVVDNKSPDGFSSTCIRTLADGLTEISRGPFVRIEDAVRYALAWTDAANAPPVPEHAVMQPTHETSLPADDLATASSDPVESFPQSTGEQKIL